MNTIQLYKLGIAMSDSENPPTLNSRYSEFKDELQELVEDKNVDELIDVSHTIEDWFIMLLEVILFHTYLDPQ